MRMWTVRYHVAWSNYSYSYELVQLQLLYFVRVPRATEKKTAEFGNKESAAYRRFQVHSVISTLPH